MIGRGKVCGQLAVIIKRHENSNTTFSLRHKSSGLKLCIDNILATIWDEMHFINIGKTGLNPV